MKILNSILLLLIFTSCASRNKKTIIAHRGAPGYLPEHTLAGVAMAHAWGVDYIEPDLVVTKDNHLVILHDTHIDTTTDVAQKFPKRKRKDGRYYAIDFTLAEIKTLNVHERISLKTNKPVYDKRFPKNKSKFKVPTFEEYIELVQGLNKSTGRNIGLYPEMKAPEFHTKEGKDIAVLTMKVLSKYGYNKKGAKIYLQCFYPPTLKRLKNKLGAKMPLIALIGENSWKESSTDYDYLQTEAGIKEISEFVSGIGPHYSQLIKTSEGINFVSSRLVEYAHKYGLKVHTYTHRSDQLSKYFASDRDFLDFVFKKAKVDGVFSDFADKAINYRNQ